MIQNGISGLINTVLGLHLGRGKIGSKSMSENIWGEWGGGRYGPAVSLSKTHSHKPFPPKTKQLNKTNSANLVQVGWFHTPVIHYSTPLSIQIHIAV